MLIKELLIVSLLVAVLNAQQEHYGTCRNVKPGEIFGTCAISCESDQSCGDGEKCCFNGCGMSCLKSCNAMYACKCPYGTIFLEEEGCQRCSCKPHPCSLVDCMPNSICKVNQDTLKAECVKECPLYKCIPCLEGQVRARDSDGCLTCKCVPAPVETNNCVDDVSSCKCETGTPFLIPVDKNCKKCNCENLCRYTRCYSGTTCVIHLDANSQPISECVPNRCETGVELQDVFCGRGPNRRDCPSGYSCKISPIDAYAVCCPQ